MSRIAWLLVSIVVSNPACHAGDRGSIPRRGDVLIFSQSVAIRAALISSEEVSVNTELLSFPSALSCESKKRSTLVIFHFRVRMAQRSKALRSGRSLPWRRGFESHF